MVAVTNAKHIFLQRPQRTMPVPGQTTMTDSSGTIDLENVSLGGGFLVKTIVLSMDPYIRNKMKPVNYDPPFEIGATIVNLGVGRVLRSENPAVPAGCHIYGMFKFVEYFVDTDADQYIVLPEGSGLPWTVWVGAAGMPGQTAFYSWKEFSYAKKGETVFVSGGAGAVGSFVIQLAKQEGLKVIASAGSDEKVKFMRAVGADVAFNYKTTSTLEMLQKEGGIDIYYDNVGGATLDAALEAAKLNARFIECGMISGYNKEEHAFKNLLQVVGKSISMNGFIITRLAHKYQDEFYKTVPKLVSAGKIRYQEHVYHGLDSACHALVDVLSGKNQGKAVIVVAEDVA